MKATGALPTEQRCKDMNVAQWLWYYFNLLEDLKEEREYNGEYAENLMDYVGHYINPKLAKYVDDQKAYKRKNKGKNVDGYQAPGIREDGTEVKDVVYNSAFEQELAEALKKDGKNIEEEFTELPSSDSAGDPYESEEDFMARVNSFSKYAGTDKFYQHSEKADRRNKMYVKEIEEQQNKFIPREPEQPAISQEDSVIMQQQEAEELLEFYKNMPVGNNGPIDENDLDYFE